MNAGFWSRIGRHLINNFLCVITLGIYWIFLCVWFLSGKQSVGMKAVKVNYSKTDSMGLFLLYLILAYLLYILFIPIIMDMISIIQRKGTFAERWADTYYVNA
ncbi:hypothetical protein SGLAD_v1c01050 [Spiroplasma gladiatoris]|uniref:Uncharacterized protein n=1 Tax=Spiroplasma gladiatoris TaxID=2143 RepID=A0A4P7AHY8_9MOLU|nr:hypothetical protein [Spiroplasma gladiatoris]QBQ07306.1 hypothetical protein SGLAD_v1c01050 [Spiroplasma gladiatoris]